MEGASVRATVPRQEEAEELTGRSPHCLQPRAVPVGEA